MAGARPLLPTSFWGFVREKTHCTVRHFVRPFNARAAFLPLYTPRQLSPVRAAACGAVTIVTMAAVLPYRDINIHSSPSHYAFSSPSSPSAPTLVIDRPSGDIRLHDGKLLGSKRVSSIAGILGIIKLRLGTMTFLMMFYEPD